MSAFVSVIMPVFNDPDRIRKALDALVDQAWPRHSYEIIVADNGSTDSTPRVLEEYCEKYPHLLRVVVETRIQSSYAARNKGLRAAQGDILAFTDSDCIPEPEWIVSGTMALAEQSAACGGGRVIFYFKSERPNVYEYLDSVRKLNQQAYVEHSGFAATANFFARQELFERHGEFCCDLISGGDYEFGRRLTRAGERIIFIPEAIVKHPARSSFRQTYIKTKRVAAGQKKLEAIGLLDHDGLSWSRMLPVLRYASDGHWSMSHSLVEKIQLVFLANVFRYVNLWRRIR